MVYFKSPKTYIIENVGEENYDKFMDFAFGENKNKVLYTNDVPEFWTKQHPDHIIDLHDEINIGMELMLNLFKEQNGK